jgi:hypothetical protein
VFVIYLRRRGVRGTLVPVEEYGVEKVYVMNRSIYVEIIRLGLWLLLSEELKSKIIWIN